MSDTIRFHATGVRVQFGATVALDGVELTACAGEIHALIGENGAGKSTLMKVLSGAVTPQSGSMEIDSVPYRPASPLEARRAGVAMIYQELSLAAHLTVAENIFLGMEPGRFMLDRASMREKATAVLKRVGHEEIDPDALAETLSISQQQLVEIARAIAFGCKILILDEPTSSLSRLDVERLFTLLRQLKQEEYAIFYISHFIEEIEEIADCYTVLRDGMVSGRGTIGATSFGQIVAMMAGRKVEEIYPRSRRTVGKIALSVADLNSASKLKSATLTLHQGEILGIAGLMGSGRSELLRAIFGSDTVRSGSIRVASFPGTGACEPGRRWEQGVGMVSEDRKAEGLALSMSVADNLILSAPDKVSRFGFLSKRLKEACTRRWCQSLSIKYNHPDQPVGTLSGGNQQKVALARLLHHDADLFLLDEPTRGIDVSSKMQIYQLIDRLACEGKSVLIVSSYLPELLGLCDRVAVMNRGRLGEARAVSDISEHSLMLEATAINADG